MNEHTCNRRAFLSSVAEGAALLPFVPLLNLYGSIPAKPAAKAVIQIWMWGGPSHLDTFDPKPEAGPDYCGPYTTPIETTVPGLRIGQLLPQLAQQAKRYSVIRSMTHGINGHETAAYRVQTGREPGDGQVYPAVGAVVALKKISKTNNLIPPYIALTKPLGRFSEPGFLGSRYKPYATGGDPNARVFAAEGVVLADVPLERQNARKGLLEHLVQASPLARTPLIEAIGDRQAEAYGLILGEQRKVFDLNLETTQTRDRYGRSTFGQSCLAARRMVENGVVFVAINYPGWDTHKQHFSAMSKKLPEFDTGLSALLEDLAQRGLLDSTIVWCGGEFGRTPKISWEAPWNGGRSHHGKAFSTLIAGGGFQGGQVIGETDAKGIEVARNPVDPADLISAIYQRLGFNTRDTLPHPQGLILPLVPPIKDKNPLECIL